MLSAPQAKKGGDCCGTAPKKRSSLAEYWLPYAADLNVIDQLWPHLKKEDGRR